MSASVSVRAALGVAVTALEEAGVPEARLVAELLLGHVLDLERAHLIAHPEHELTARDQARLSNLLRRALRHEPLAYLIHRREFYGLAFYVDRRVLIPRPETEGLVEAAIAWAKGYVDREGLAPHVADVGTGSGAIAVTLAVHLPRTHVYAVDLSPGALRVARRNARCHGVADRVSFLQGNLLAPLPAPVDLVCANLPYVSGGELAALAPGVAAHEPRLALAGGDDGLDLYRALLAQVPTALRPGGVLVLEIGAAQGESAATLAREALPEAEVAVLPDLAGLPRVLQVQMPAGPGGA